MCRIIISIGFILIITSCSCKDRGNKADLVNIKNDQLVIQDNTSKKVQVDISEILERNKYKGEYYFLLKDSLITEDLKYIPPSILRLIRNEIFAKYCYKFKNSDLKKYFGRFDWYVPYFKNVDTLLTNIDKNNIEVLLKAEKENDELSKTDLFNIYLSQIGKSSKALCYLFDCCQLYTDYSEEYTGGYIDEYVLKSSTEFKYILSGYFGGCNECSYEYTLKQYDKEGDLLRQYSFNGNMDLNEKYVDFSDSLIIEWTVMGLKDEYQNISDSIYNLDYTIYDISIYYNYIKHTSKVYLEDNDDITIIEFTAGNTR